MELTDAAAQPQEDKLQQFIERIDRLEERFKGNKYHNDWLMPKAWLIAVRDELKQRGKGGRLENEERKSSNVSHV